VDGSSQDKLGVAFAQQCHDRFGSTLSVVDARENEDSDAFTEEVANRLGGQSVAKPSGDSFDQILAAVHEVQCDLLITPCPYGRDLESVGPNSVGTVIDVLLARCPVPILVIRQPYEPQGEVFQKVRMVLSAENEAAEDAAAWATGFVAPQGSLQLWLELEQEMYENMAALMQSIAPDVDVSTESLSQALAKTHTRLHRALQMAAGEQGFRYKLKLQMESEGGPAAASELQPNLLVTLAFERSDHASQGNIQSRIRLSADPVLVVCTAQEAD
jgi:hypothetical protein